MPLLSPSENYLILFSLFEEEMLPQLPSSPTSSKMDETATGTERKALDSGKYPFASQF